MSIDFANIKKTVDGFDCHYFGMRESFGSMIHCFGVFHPKDGVREVAYDSEGKRLRFDMGEWVLSLASNFQIVTPRRKVQSTRWLCFAYRPEFIVDQIVVHLFHREPTTEEIDLNKYLAVKKITTELEVPE